METFFQLILNTLAVGSVYAIVSCGFNLAFRVLGYYYIIFGGLLMLSAISGCVLLTVFHLPWLLALIGAGVLTLGAALLDYCVLSTPLRRRGSTNLVLFLASTASYFIIENLVLIVVGPEPRAFPTSTMGGIVAFGAKLPMTSLCAIVISITWWILLTFIVYGTRLGLAMRAVSENEVLATLEGIAAGKIRMATIVCVALIATSAGFVVGLNATIRFSAGMPILLKGILTSLLGGVGSISGVVLAGLAVASLETAAVWLLPPGYNDIAVFSLLALMILIRPRALGLIEREA